MTELENKILEHLSVKETYRFSSDALEKSKEKLNEYTEEAVKAIEDYYDNAAFFRDLVLKLSTRKR